MKVEQFFHANQFHLYGEDKNILQSYDSKVVEITNYQGCYQCIILGRDWDYSTTTSKHVYEFLDQYSNIRIYGVKNKRKYINDLIEECKSDKVGFIEQNRCVLIYDENMH